MEKAQIKKTQRMAQNLLEQLQGTDATFLFIGDEGNCFTIAGEKSGIEAQLIFAMSRYPVVKDIIHNCSKKYDMINQQMGDDMRNITLEHLIEINSGNPGIEK